ncbi:hypothetical protein [Ruminococcus sp. Marseille-P6503]|uniref:hypothetical protein n=1 Tax=Ruminococcus sp. Marseille-P6503 TaxID=2364796 RepID=UPI000F53A5D9|nr:hypothetical protein [Ruminococcus sp. Marseille-P6503]
MNSSKYKSNIRSFNESDSWNTSRYIVYSCKRRSSYRCKFDPGTEAVLRTDNLMQALAYIKKNSDRINHYKLYDRKLVTFDRKRIMRAAMLEEEER